MGYDFESDKKYNIEKFVSMTIQLNKTCYSPGEYVNGTIILKPKEGLQQPLLQDTNATLYLTEFFYYRYHENQYDPHKKRNESVPKDAEESVPLLTLPMNFSNFYNANIMTTVNIPFQIQIPMTCYPSCIFDSLTYVKHYLAIDFPSIRAKKTEIIVIKNNSYFSKYNGLYQEPAVCYKETTKRKLFVSQGSFSANLKLPRNTFSYDEMIPFEVDIDATKLSIAIRAIRISINRNQRKNYQRNHQEARGQNKKECITKIIPLPKGQKKHHIEDVIQLKPENNPKETYKILDTDKRKYSEKYSGVKLSPTCYGGLISCEYYIKMVLEMDTLLSTDEDIRIPIDLYEPFMPNYSPNAQYPQQPYPQSQPPYPQQPYPPQQQPYPQQPPQQPYPSQQQPYPQPQYPPQQQPPQQQPYPQPQYPPQQQPPQQQPYPPQQQQPYPQPQYPPQQQPYPQQTPQQPYPPQQQQPYPQPQYPPQQQPPQQQPYPQQTPQQQYPPQQQPPQQQPYPQPQYPPQQQPPQQQPYPQPQYPPQQQPYPQQPPQQQYPPQMPPQTIPASVPQNVSPNDQEPNLPSQEQVNNNNFEKPSEPPSNQLNSYPSFDNNNNAAPPTLDQMLQGK